MIRQMRFFEQYKRKRPLAKSAKFSVFIFYRTEL